MENLTQDQKMKEKGQIGVYVISNIHPNRHNHLDAICSKLNSRYLVFRPHKDNQYNLDNSKIEFGTFYIDQQEMDKADVSLVLMPLFGRDCAAEIGYSQGIGNVVIAYVESMATEQERDWLNDWMVKGFLDYVITPEEETYQLLSSNPLIAQKTAYQRKNGKSGMVHKIRGRKDLSNLIEKLSEEKCQTRT